MGVCQTSNLDGMILVYERIAGGSLYNYLHQKVCALNSLFSIYDNWHSHVKEIL